MNTTMNLKLRSQMFEVGDMVKMAGLLGQKESVGYIIEMGHNGFAMWAKVKFFDDIEDTYTTYIEKLRKA